MKTKITKPKTNKRHFVLGTILFFLSVIIFYFVSSDANVYNIASLRATSTLALVSDADVLSDLEEYKNNTDLEGLRPETSGAQVEFSEEKEKEDSTFSKDEVVVEIVEPLANAVFLKDDNGIPQSYVAYSFSEPNSWENAYGLFYIKDGKLFLGASDGTSSFARILAGGEWKNYSLSTTFDWHKGSSVSIVFRYQDSKNYAYCGYSLYGNRVTMYTIENGERITHGKSPRIPIPHFEPWKDVSVGLRVENQHATCLKDGNIVLSYELPNIPKIGKVGVKTWSNEVGYSLIGLKRFEVTPH